MRNLQKWAWLFGFSGLSLHGVSCATDFRDALLTGTLDFVSGTTTEMLAGMLPLPALLAGGG